MGLGLFFYGKGNIEGEWAIFLGLICRKPFAEATGAGEEVDNRDGSGHGIGFLLSFVPGRPDYTSLCWGIWNSVCVVLLGSGGNAITAVFSVGPVRREGNGELRIGGSGRGCGGVVGSPFAGMTTLDPQWGRGTSGPALTT